RFCMFHSSLTAILIGMAGLAARADDAGFKGVRAVKGVYATRPRDYPAGPGHAQPDLDVPFRWHGYHDDIRRFNDARMSAHVESYNPLEDAGVTAAAPVRFAFVTEHATSGK